MSRLSKIELVDAKGYAKDFYDVLNKNIGRVPNIFKIMGNSPAVVEMFSTMKKSLSKGVLPAKIIERIALVCAKANSCEYCVAAHTVGAKGAGLSDLEIQQTLKIESDELKIQGILSFVNLMVEKKAEISDIELQKIKDLGVSDEEIVEIIGHVSLNIFTNYINHIAETEIDF